VNVVGIVSIALGVVTMCSRGCLLAAPVPTLRWFRNVAGTNRGLRTLGSLILLIGFAMIWAGSLEDSGLATVLFFVGFAFVGISTLLLLLFPGAYRDLVNSTMPEDSRGVMIFLRFKGIAGIFVGAAFIYFGVRAL
jgi:hypothetical protein